jgi:hypothetical protein
MQIVNMGVLSSGDYPWKRWGSCAFTDGLIELSNLDPPMTTTPQNLTPQIGMVATGSLGQTC